MRQWRVVYEYKSEDGRVNGAGACFIIAPGEFEARALFAKTWPEGTITSLSEELDDPRRLYERPEVQQ